MPSIIDNLQQRQNILDPVVPASNGVTLPSMDAATGASNTRTGTPVSVIIALTITSVFIVVLFGLFVVWQLHKYQIEEMKRHSSRERLHQFRQQNSKKISTSPKPNEGDDKSDLANEHKGLPDDIRSAASQNQARNLSKETPKPRKESFPRIIPRDDHCRGRWQSLRGSQSDRPFDPIARQAADHNEYRDLPCAQHMSRYPRQGSFGLQPQDEYPQQNEFEQHPRDRSLRATSFERPSQHRHPQPDQFEQQTPGPTFPSRMYNSPWRTQRSWGSADMQFNPRPTMVPSWPNPQGGNPASQGTTRSRQQFSPTFFYPAAPPPTPRFHGYHAVTVEDDSDHKDNHNRLRGNSSAPVAADGVGRVNAGVPHNHKPQKYSTPSINTDFDYGAGSSEITQQSSYARLFGDAYPRTLVNSLHSDSIFRKKPDLGQIHSPFGRFGSPTGPVYNDISNFRVPQLFALG